jgi:AcrR family transcriptional regulator
MPRPQAHRSDTILDAALATLVDDGARAATIERIAARSGAPTGSLYHRFGSREAILVALWVRTVRRFQQGFLAAIEADDPLEAAVAAGLWTVEFCRRHPAEARLLTTMRLSDVVGTGGPADLNAAAEAAVRALARRLYGNARRPAIDRVALAVVDLPYGAVRRHVGAGKRVPAAVRDRLAAAIVAVLDD